MPQKTNKQQKQIHKRPQDIPNFIKLILNKQMDKLYVIDYIEKHKSEQVYLTTTTRAKYKYIARKPIFGKMSAAKAQLCLWLIGGITIIDARISRDCSH